MWMNLAIIVALTTLLWGVSLIKRDASIIDPFWGLGFVVVAWSSRWQAITMDLFGLLIVLLTTIWGVRLCGYLIWRNWGKGEDRRYTAMRDKHGARFWWVSLLTVFTLQAVLIWVISFPIQVAVMWDAELGIPLVGYVVAAVGTALWSIGFFFESVGDFQMAKFKSNPANRGRVMNRGLWYFTRHPNYFGDFCVWWGIYLVSLAGGAWWTLFSPVLMAYLLMKVSGVVMLEGDIEERRPDYAEYKRTTSPFFPRLPKPTHADES